MPIFGFRARGGYAQRDRLPEVDSFVDMALKGSSTTQSVQVLFVSDAGFTINRPTAVRVGNTALFNYVTGRGQFRFRSDCTNVGEMAATFALPAGITVVDTIIDRRRGFRLKCAIPLVWRLVRPGLGPGEYTAGTTLDLSSGGVSLDVTEKLATGSRLELELALEADVKPLHLFSTLTRPTTIQPDGARVAAAAFDHLSPTMANALSDMIREQRRRG
jgi:hypothetical protein